MSRITGATGPHWAAQHPDLGWGRRRSGTCLQSPACWPASGASAPAASASTQALSVQHHAAAWQHGTAYPAISQVRCLLAVLRWPQQPVGSMHRSTAQEEHCAAGESCRHSCERSCMPGQRAEWGLWKRRARACCSPSAAQTSARRCLHSSSAERTCTPQTIAMHRCAHHWKSITYRSSFHRPISKALRPSDQHHGALNQLTEAGWCLQLPHISQMQASETTQSADACWLVAAAFPQTDDPSEREFGRLHLLRGIVRATPQWWAT